MMFVTDEERDLIAQMPEIPPEIDLDDVMEDELLLWWIGDLDFEDLTEAAQRVVTELKLVRPERD